MSNPERCVFFSGILCALAGDRILITRLNPAGGQNSERRTLIIGGDTAGLYYTNHLKAGRTL